MINTGRAIKIALIDIDKTQGWLAKQLGISRQYMNLMCHKKSCSMEFMDRVADCCGLSTLELLKLGE